MGIGLKAIIILACGVALLIGAIKIGIWLQDQADK